MFSLLNTISFLGASGVTASIDRETPLAERLALGGEVLLIGLGTVFSVLLILWGALEIFRLVFYTLPNRRAAEAAAKQEELNAADYAADAAAGLTYEEPAADLPYDDNDDGAIVAAITAAITAYRAAEQEAMPSDAPSTRFRVVSFRKIG